MAMYKTANLGIPVRFRGSSPILFVACLFTGQALAEEPLMEPRESLEAIIAPETTPPGCALDFLFLTGMFGRAVTCDHDWLERGAVTMVFKELERCKGLSDSGRDAILKRGTDKYNENEQKFGHEEVCKQLDDYMIEIETILNQPPTDDYDKN